MAEGSRVSTDNEDTPNSQTVSDPEEFNQQRRLRSIHDARDRAREMRELTQDPSVDADRQTLAANYRAAVQNYIGELEGLLRRYEFGDDETDYWQSYLFGPVEIPPPPELTQLRKSDSVQVIGTASLSPQSRAVIGLNGYLSANCPFEATFALPVEVRHEGQDTITASVSMEMPIRVSHEAFRIANRFFTSVGFDVEIESSEHRAVIDDELIEEVNEWHKQNVQT